MDKQTVIDGFTVTLTSNGQCNVRKYECRSSLEFVTEHGYIANHTLKRSIPVSLATQAKIRAFAQSNA